MPQQYQNVNVQVGILTFYISFPESPDFLKFPIAAVQAELTGQIESRSQPLTLECNGMCTFVFAYEGVRYASGLIKYQTTGESSAAILAELNIGKQSDQQLFNVCLASVPPESEDLVPLNPAPVNPTSNIAPPGIVTNVAIHNAAFTDLFHFVGLRQASLLPPRQDRYFFSLNTHSAFYKKLQDAVKTKKALRPIAVSFLDATCKTEIIREILQRELFWLIELFKRLRKQVREDFSSANTIAQKGLTGSLGLESLEIIILEPLVETLKDCLTAIMLVELAPKSANSKSDPEKPPGTDEFEKLLLLLRLITYYLRHIGGESQDQANAVLEAIAILPQEIFGSFLPANSLSSNAKNSNSVSPLGIGELMVLRQTIQGYQMGELAFIENVMAGEKKIRARKVHTNEDVQAKRQDSNDKVQQHDSQSDTTYDIFQEISALIRNDKESFQFQAAPTSSPAGPPPADAPKTGLVKCFDNNCETISGGWTLVFDPSGNSKAQALDFVRQLTANASARMLARSRESHVRILSEEYSKIEKHIFDNTDGNEPIIGIYRWVEKVMLARLVSLGERLLVQFDIGNPADMLPGKKKFDPEPGLPSLALLESADYEVLTPDLYFRYSAMLGIEDLVLPPEKKISVSGILNSETQNNQQCLRVPHGYQATEVSASYLYNGTKISIIAGEQMLKPKGAADIDVKEVQTTVQEWKEGEDPIKPIVLPGIPDMFPKKIDHGKLSGTISSQDLLEIPVSVLTDASFYAVNLVLDCGISNEFENEWKVRAWSQLIRALKEQRFREEHRPPRSQEAEIARERQNMVRDTLRQEAIGLLLAGLKSEEGSTITSGLEGFLKDAFLWNEMTIQFLPEKPNGEGTWIDLAFDPRKPGLFDAFLKAKTARLVVGVRQKFELIGLYAIWTNGRFWDGLPGDAPILEDYVFYADQLLFDKGDGNSGGLKREFTLTSPTDMMVLQQSAQLPHFQSPVSPLEPET